MRAPYSFVWYELLFIATFLFDRITKFYAMQFSEPYSVNAFLSCQLTLNRGVSWSFFDSADDRVFMVLTAFLLLIIGSLAFYTYIRWMNRCVIFGEILVLSGAVSNIIDRFAYHGVIDFIFFHCSNLSFPIFNCADIFIVVGVMIMIVMNYMNA